METPHQRLSHSRHRQQAEANLLQLVQHQARWVVHMVLRTKISINKVILPSTDVGFLSFSKLCLESTWLLSVLVLFHFLPHLGSFPRSIWIRLPMTTLPCSVTHHLEWFTLGAEAFLNHTFFIPASWFDLSSAVNMCTLTAKKKETPTFNCQNWEIWPCENRFSPIQLSSACLGSQH